ncbi:MAG: hypothetical protein AMS17_03885 [Spirochaetes bacterium DG_61]|jgi:hypothetical protein|nr:MAG: hypothetical protein AMS17_03885 [Spirochaetes bacterium DG_61]
MKTVQERAMVRENEIYFKAIETFIRYLEEKQNDKFWLVVNHHLLEDMFRALLESEDENSLLPALKVLQKDPGFSAVLDANLLNVVLQYSLVA